MGMWWGCALGGGVQGGGTGSKGAINHSLRPPSVGARTCLLFVF